MDPGVAETSEAKPQNVNDDTREQDILEKVPALVPDFCQPELGQVLDHHGHGNNRRKQVIPPPVRNAEHSVSLPILKPPNP